MTEREQKIREAVARLSQTGSGVSPEFTLLSLSDTQFLLEELSFLRNESENRVDLKQLRAEYTHLMRQADEIQRMGDYSNGSWRLRQKADALLRKHGIVNVWELP